MDRLIRKLKNIGVEAFDVENHNDIISMATAYINHIRPCKDFTINDIGYNEVPEKNNSDALSVYIVNAVLAIEESAVFVMNEAQIYGLLKKDNPALFIIKVEREKVVDNIELAMFWINENLIDINIKPGFLRPKYMPSSCIVALT